MAYGIYFDLQGFPTSVYDEAIEQLSAAGAGFGEVPGRTFHCAMTTDDGQIKVFDVWDSMEAFEKFGETLMPILGGLGADPGQPMVMSVHNLQHS
jgi:hypothetical protein